jgi:hypothetical protein
VKTLLILLLIPILVVLIIAATGLDYTAKRIWTFQRKRLRHETGSSRAQLLARFSRPPKLQADLREIRDLIISLQLGTSMQETLSGALLRAAEQFKDRGSFGQRLWTQTQARLSTAPEEVVKGLAEDFGSSHLRDLLQRLEMARDGGITYDQALTLTVDQVENEIRGDLRRDIQQMPIQLTLPMIAAVFLPAIMIGLFPIVVTFLSQLSVRFTGPGG